MAQAPLMPRATAVWLVDHTCLSFDQIADLCQLHPLEIKAIADGEAAQGIKGLDPITHGQLTREEIDKGQADESYRLTLRKSQIDLPRKKSRKPRYTPLSRRQDRPNAILWLVRNHPELKNAQIMRLIGTTKPTIQAIRDRTHWNSANLTPTDPVTLGLCSQIDLDAETAQAMRDAPPPEAAENTRTLASARQTVPETVPDIMPDSQGAQDYEQALPDGEITPGPVAGAPLASIEAELDIDKVFQKLSGSRNES